MKCLPSSSSIPLLKLHMRPCSAYVAERFSRMVLRNISLHRPRETPILLPWSAS